MSDSRIYILASSDRHLEVFRLDSGEIAIHTPALVSAEDAMQISLGIRAVLSGNFDRAVSEDTLRFDLERRLRSSSAEARTTSLPNLKPELDML